MKNNALHAKIALFIWLTILLVSCNAIKRVPAGQKLLVKTNVVVDSIAPESGIVENGLIFQPNKRLLSVPLGLHLYNLARPNRDSIFLKHLQDHPEQTERRNNFLSEKQHMRLGESLVKFNQWLRNTGEAPSIITDEKVTIAKERLKAYYWSKGYFNVEVALKIKERSKKQRADLTYYVTKNDPYIIDSISSKIESPAVDSIYQKVKASSYVKSGEQYNTSYFNLERDRLNKEFRNNGLYYMGKEYIQFEGDTVKTDNKANITLLIKNREIKVADSIIEKPFLKHHISKVNILPDYQNSIDEFIVPDTVRYDGYNIIRYGKRKYKKEVLTDAMFFHEGDIYRDLDRDRTYKRITELKSFVYPTIRYIEDPADSTGQALIANVLLSSLKRFQLKYGTETTHSNIQALGIGVNTSLLIRNLFRGSELLDINFRGSIGASSNTATGDSRFFDLQEFGADARLNLPRLFLPFDTDRYIPKYMSPNTKISAGYFSQTNIGLDKTSLNSTLSYGWRPTATNSVKVDLIDVQFVNNQDPADFYNVYSNTYRGLNAVAEELGINNPIYLNDNGDLSIPEGTRLFTNDVLNGTIATVNSQLETVRNIEERRDRLTQNNLIISTSFSWARNTQQGIFDDDYSSMSIRLESAGNVLAGITSLVDAPVNDNGNREAFGVEFSQYVKTEIDYIKNWQMFSDDVFAIRAFGGIAIPYGNSNNIPFIRSFFAGGPNDNRAWQAYELGPGRTGGINDFNEANMKIALNGEYRFTLAGAFKGALFVDAGNIWNVLDNEDDPDAQFQSLSDLGAIAVGTGFGVRYDFDYFVIRLDAGFKTYNPALPKGRRWFREISPSRAVLNVGINYPF